MSSNPVYFTPSDDYHIMSKGETLQQVSQEYSISIEKLKIFNNLNTNNVFIGQKVYLKPHRNGKSEYVTVRSIPENGYHIVKKGETLTRISKMYDVVIIDLIDYNNLRSLNLTPGQKIWLRPGSAEETSKAETHEQPQSKAKEKVAAVVIPEKKVKPKTYNIPKNTAFLPAQGEVTSEFGMRNGRPHKGIDISGAMGSPIHAVKAGSVVYAGSQRGYGNVIILEHDDDTMTVYAHNEANLVRVGDHVTGDQPIATMGNTGNSSGTHLHFEYRVNGKAINPREVFSEL